MKSIELLFEDYSKEIKCVEYDIRGKCLYVRYNEKEYEYFNVEKFISIKVRDEE